MPPSTPAISQVSQFLGLVALLLVPSMSLPAHLVFRKCRQFTLLLLLGIFCAANVAQAQTATPVPSAVGFGSIAVGTTSAIQTVTFTFTAPAVLGSTPFGVYTETALDHEFTAAQSQAGSPCVASHPYSVGNTCTVQIVLAPTRPGLLLGAVQLLDSSGATLANTPLSGVGTGPMLTFNTQTSKVLYNGSPVRVAVDRSGDVFIAESTSSGGNGTVKLLVASGGVIPSTATPVTLASNFGNITGLAVGGAGDVFVADNGSGAVKEIVATAGSFVTNPVVNTVYSGSPLAVAVDAAGNLLVTEGSVLKRIAAVNGVIGTASPATTIVTGLNSADGLAVDQTGDIYIADTGNSAIKMAAASGGLVTPASPVTTVLSPEMTVQDIALDAAGDLFVSLYGFRVVELQAVNGIVPQNAVSFAVGSSPANIRGIAVNARGDIYIADDQAHVVYTLDNGDPPTLAFTAVKPPVTSSSQPVIYANGGNTTLTFPVPASGTNPSTPADFTLQSTSGCPVLTPNATAALTLDPGVQCELYISSAPTTPGPITESAVFTDNSLNVAGATQSESLSGFGLGSLGTGGLIDPGFTSTTTYVGTTDTQTATATLLNLTASAITLTTPTLTDSADFSATDTCNGTIAANAECSVTFTFHPTTVGTITSTYTVADPNVPNAPVTIQLSAVAVPAQVDARANYTVTTSAALAGIPVGLALGKNGNLYFGEYLANTGYVLMSLPGVGGAVSLTSTASQISAAGTNVLSVATDDQGDVFYLDIRGSLNELAAVNGTVPASATPTTLIQFNLGSGSELNGALLVDHIGDIFFEATADQYPYNYEYLEEAVAVNGVIPANPTINVLQTDTNQYGGPGVHLGGNFIDNLAVDTGNDLYYVYEASTLNKLAAVSGVLPASPQPQVQPGAPTGNVDRYDGPFLVDPGGDVIYTHGYLDANNNGVTQVLKLIAVNGVLPQYPQVQLLYTAPTSSFQPSGMVQDASGNVFIANNRTSTIVEISPNATAAGALSIAPVTQMFPSQFVGKSSAPLTSTITNTTANTVHLSAGALTDAKDFAASDDCDSTVAADGTCTVTFTFTPGQVGSAQSTYTIADANNPSSVLTVALSGIGTSSSVPEATLLPSPLSFTTVAGTPAKAQTAMLTNGGAVPLSIASLTLTGANATAFSSTTTCGTSLAAGASCQVAVQFSPSTAGSFTATLVATDNAGLTAGSTQTIALNGTATAPPAPTATLTPATFTFAATPLGATSPAATFTLTNAGTAALPVSSVVLAGADAARFTLAANTCGRSLAAGAACTVQVAFSPATSATATTTLAITDSVGTQTAAISGSGINPVQADFTIAASPATQSTYRGAAVSYMVHLTSADGNNPFSSTVSLGVTGLPAGASATFSPANVVPGGGATSTLTVQIPSLSASRGVPVQRGLELTGVSAATLLILLWPDRRRLAARLLLVLLGFGVLTAGLTGCGSGNGFAIPSSQSTLVISGTAGSLTHTTSVSLTER